MSSQQEHMDYLSEHLFYELLMLRYTFKRLNEVADQLLWNALYESFGVHARNLYDFLRNEKDQRNFKASDFIEKFDCGDRKKLSGTFDKMQQQIMHLGKRRVWPNDEKRITLDDIKQINGWIEAAIEKFSSELPSNYKVFWKPEDADPFKSSSEIKLFADLRSQSSSPAGLGLNLTQTGTFVGNLIPKKVS